MGVETATERKRKRIVEVEIDGFRTAKDALTFATTVKQVVDDTVGVFKFRSGIGKRGTQLAITPEYVGETSLKVTFLELPGNEAANAVLLKIKDVVKNYRAVRNVALRIAKDVVRDKPLPQTIGSGQPPKLSLTARSVNRAIH